MSTGKTRLPRLRHPRLSCEGKRRYSQRGAAAAARRSSLASGQAIRAYRCAFDPDHWHIGHVEPRWKRREAV